MIYNCIFCNVESKYGFGVLEINDQGKQSYFCSKKCRMNSMNKRNLKYAKHKAKSTR